MRGERKTNAGPFLFLRSRNAADDHADDHRTFSLHTFFETPSHRVDATTLVLSGIVLSFVISGPVSWVAQYVIEFIPKFGTGLKERQKRRALVDSNWRMAHLDVHLSRDDRENVEFVGHYMLFNRVLCFYLTLYFVVNVGLLLDKLTSGDFPSGGTVASYLAWCWQDVKTPVFGGVEVPTVVVILISLSTIIYLLYDYLKKYEQLFLPDGDYDNLAEKYQREKGNIAASVWGRVTTVEKDGKELDCPVSVSGLGVWLVNTDGSEVRPSKTDAQGYFQFKDAFAICRQGCRMLKFDETYMMGTKVYSVGVLSPASLAVTLADEKAVPFFPITVALVEKNQRG